MRFALRTPLMFCAIGCATILYFSGCGQTDNANSVSQETDEHADHDHGPGEEHASHDHSGWWCNEHGVPEEVCTRCSSGLIADFKENGDWCDEHDRPGSQCFHCDPELEEKFAAKYVAKYGKEPPKPTDP